MITFASTAIPTVRTIPAIPGSVKVAPKRLIIAKRIRRFANAMRAILDANITTLIASVVLYAYGTGAIKGFAVTMSIGIMASMLTAILGTHGIYQLFDHKISKSKNNKFWFGIKG